MVLMSLVLLLLAAERVALKAAEDPLGEDTGKESEDERPEGQTPIIDPLLTSPHHAAIGEDTWRMQAIGRMWRLRKEMARTPLTQFPLPPEWSSRVFFKNESASPTGSCKHRYAWQLFMWALVEGKIHSNTTIYEASSGNTAASEAFYAHALGLNFTAVVPDTIEQIKIDHIIQFGGSEPIRVPIGERLRVAASKADETGGFFMNQFAHADVAEEFHESGNWRQESTNVLHEIFSQLHERGMAEPDFFVHAAGTGGTISSAGRYARRYGMKTKIVLADTEFSVYADYVLNGRFGNESGASLWVPPGMAGIGYGPMGKIIKGETSSLDKEVIDEVYKVPDIASAAAMRVLQDLNFSGGTSSGINFLVALAIAAKYPGSTIVTPMGDPAVNYASSYLNRTWIAERFGPAADSSGVQQGRRAVLEQYDCWCSIIHASLAVVQDPIALGGRLCEPASDGDVPEEKTEEDKEVEE